MKRLHHEFKPYEEDGANSDVGYDNEDPCRFYDERDEETEEKYLEIKFFEVYRMGIFYGVLIPKISLPINSHLDSKLRRMLLNLTIFLMKFYPIKKVS